MLTGDKFISEVHLRQLRFTYGAFRPFTESKERMQNFKRAKHVSQLARGNFKDLRRRTASDKLSRDITFDIAKNLKDDGNQRGLASMVYNFFNKKGNRWCRN